MKKNYLSPEIETTEVHFTSVLCDSGASGEETSKGQMSNPFSAPARPF